MKRAVNFGVVAACIAILLIFRHTIWNAVRSHPQNRSHSTQNRIQPLPQLGLMKSLPPIRPWSPELETALPARMRLIREQAAVYRVLCYGDGELRLPARLTVDTRSIKAEFERATLAKRAQGYLAFAWSRVADDPDRYLIESADFAARRVTNTLLMSGTAFLVSREGILLTNAHVVSNLPDQPLPSDPNVLRSMIGGRVAQWISILSKRIFGGPPPPDELPKVASALLRWLGEKGRITGTFRRAVIALDVGRPDFPKGLVAMKALLKYLHTPPRPITAPVRVLAKGVPFPGKDVAVLQAEPGDFDLRDRGIAVPLGDSDDVLPGASVEALGFPAVAFDAAVMRPEAAFRVSAENGQIENTKPIVGGWNAFEMTANINHGDSGGPVFDAKGYVIALNVAGPQGDKGGHTLAVPVGLARELLARLHIDPDPGPVTALWLRALTHFAKGKYDAARNCFEEIEDIEKGARSVDSPGPQWRPTENPMELSSRVNPYVSEMMSRVFEKTHR